MVSSLIYAPAFLPRLSTSIYNDRLVALGGLFTCRTKFSSVSVLKKNQPCPQPLQSASLGTSWPQLGLFSMLAHLPQHPQILHAIDSPFTQLVQRRRHILRPRPHRAAGKFLLLGRPRPRAPPRRGWQDMPAARNALHINVARATAARLHASTALSTAFRSV